MHDHDVHRPILGEPNAPCRACGAPLAVDQRYCLQCGERRAEARLPFLDILAGRGVAGAAVVEETTTVERRSAPGLVARSGSNAAAVAGVGCLLLALGVGVLIGGLGDDGRPSASAAPPQVISVGGVAPAAAVTSTATPAATDAGDSSSSASKAKKKKAGKTSSDAGDSAPAVKTKATNKALKELDSASPEEYQKKAAKLPKTLGTGGAPPPKDDKPAAGGGAFEEIG